MAKLSSRSAMARPRGMRDGLRTEESWSPQGGIGRDDKTSEIKL